MDQRKVSDRSGDAGSIAKEEGHAGGITEILVAKRSRRVSTPPSNGDLVRMLHHAQWFPSITSTSQWWMEFSKNSLPGGTKILAAVPWRRRESAMSWPAVDSHTRSSWWLALGGFPSRGNGIIFAVAREANTRFLLTDKDADGGKQPLS